MWAHLGDSCSRSQVGKRDLLIFSLVGMTATWLLIGWWGNRLFALHKEEWWIHLGQFVGKFIETEIRHLEAPIALYLRVKVSI